MIPRPKSPRHASIQALDTAWRPLRLRHHKGTLVAFWLRTLCELPDMEGLEDAGLLNKEKLLADIRRALGLFEAEEHNQA